MTTWVRPLDSAVGGVGGAALGVLGYLLFKHKRSGKGAAWAAAIGAGLGAGAANIAGTLGRRYLTNTIYPYGYGSEEAMGSVTPKSWSEAGRKFWRSAVEDKLDPEIEGRIPHHPALLARRELMRRNMGVNDAQDNWFTPNADNSLRLNEKTLEAPQVTPLREQTRQALLRMLDTEVGANKPALGPSDSPEARHSGVWPELLGGYGRDVSGKAPAITDTWQYALSPDQDKYIAEVARAKAQGRMPPSSDELLQRDEDSQFYYNPVGGYRQPDPEIQKSLGMRWMASKVFDDNPVKIRIPADPSIYGKALQLPGA